MTQKQAAAPKVVQPIDEVRNALVKMGDQFKTALPSHISPDKFQRVVMTAIQQSPDLLLADRHSLYGACMRAAQDGLLPDGRESALVVYNSKASKKGEPDQWIKKVQYQPMISGILKKIRNSGEIASITAQLVRSEDAFDLWIDEEGEHLKHRPALTSDRGEVTHAYMLAKTKDGGVYFEIMTKDEIEKVRASSKAKDSGPWKDWWDEMAKKTVLRRGSKKLPMSTDIEELIRADDELYDLAKTDERDVSQAKTKPSRLGKLIASDEAAANDETSEEAGNDVK